MSNLALSIGQASDKGVKPLNQDFYGATVPQGRSLALKGAVIALADGISSSQVSHLAAEVTIKALMGDYFATSDTWSVRTSALRVLAATNAWLFAQTARARTSDMDRGYVCTVAAVIVKGRHAHLFHAGDSRIFRVSGQTLEPLTRDHTTVLSASEQYLARAMGLANGIEIDYREEALDTGDIFALTSDGVHEYLSPETIAGIIAKTPDLEAAAQTIVTQALAQGSPDNCTVQLLRIDALPDATAPEVIDTAATLAPAPLLSPPCIFDGWRIERTLHANDRSQIYLASDIDTGQRVALKVPSAELRDSPDVLRRFMMEDWIARRISSPHVLAAGPDRDRSHLYVTSEFIEGQTLRDWMHDTPRPSLAQVRDIVDQIATGLRAFHRREMVHQDLRPENVMIDAGGTVKLIDFGATRVAGVVEAAPVFDDTDILGTMQYAAPEYFAGYQGDDRSDLYSLGVIAYEMLTGRLPFGANVARATTLRAQRRLRYAPASDVPLWVDAALKQATAPDPRQRTQALSEFTANLKRPMAGFDPKAFAPLASRDPLVFWQSLCAGLILVIVALLAR
ncbi:Serine/threonine-protein kinase PrkC [Aquimixticola soesokkakensis]|uniref:Serine/threonine-protein kinase PrkC n=1 Tax=Aquimixticola soesokkakensis TaxID=1519096 RepID=A0A1Y5SXI0_9RHOB|nr:bifunctional protein-serine/threonine kinase/phosphatase [Aquimixticola soesokkakensis]SLN51191.1 Serine/threonine-protein kinase PrkC [Aquimixticola soesokkakensis]